jgi:oligosaccharide repeat unit polymerase
VLSKAIWVPIAVGLIDAAWLFLQRGLSGAAALSFQALMAVSAANRGEQYAGEADTPVGERIAFTILYLGAAYGGVLFRLSDRRRIKALAIASLGALILINTLHGSRFGSIYGGAFWLSAYLAVHVALSDPVRGVSSAFLFRFAMAGVSIVFVFSLVTMAVRYSIFSTGGSEVGWAYMLTDPFGFIAAFGLWFGESGTHPVGPLLGARTFRRIAGLWGANYPLYDAIDFGFNSSNVYTIFRELIEDFTLFGSLEVLLFYGFLARMAFWAAARRHSSSAITCLAVCYIFAFTSVASSAFAYTTIAAAALLFILTARLLPPLTIDASAEEREPHMVPAPSL